MPKRLLIIAISLACVSHMPTQAQPTPEYLDLGRHGNCRLAVSTATKAFRIGNAAQVRVAALCGQRNGMAGRLLLACDGSWITSFFTSIFELQGGTATFEELFKKLETQDSEQPVPLDPIVIEDADSTTVFYAKPVLQKSASICKTARKEPRNVFIPVSATDAQETGTTTSITLGTAARTGHVVDIWTRRSNFRQVPALQEDGKPIEYQGQAVKLKQPTGEYSMVRSAYNCKTRAVNHYQLVIYKQNVSSPETINPSNSAFESVVPGSVGENVLDVVCSLYGSK